MKLSADVVVLGMKKFKGEVDGKAYDSTTIFVEEAFGAHDETRRGSTTIAYSAGKSEVFDSLAKHPFPMQARLDLEVNPDGKGGSKTVVRAIVPSVKKAA